jgi:hypothetical protein
MRGEPIVCRVQVYCVLDNVCGRRRSSAYIPEMLRLQKLNLGISGMYAAKYILARENFRNDTRITLFKRFNGATLLVLSYRF